MSKVVNMPTISGKGADLRLTIGPLTRTEDVRELRAATDKDPAIVVPVIAQDFTFVRTEPTTDGAKTTVDTVTTVETLRLVPEGIASGVIKRGTSEGIESWVYWSCEGITVPYVYADGTVKAKEGLGSVKAENRRPFYDLGTGKEGDGRRGGAYDTITTTLFTTGLSNYFVNVEKDAPGDGKTGTVPYAKTVADAKLDAERNWDNLIGMGMIPEAMATPENKEKFIAKAVETAVERRKEEVEKRNAANPTAPQVDPATLTMETKTKKAA